MRPTPASTFRATQLDLGLANLMADLAVIPGSNGRTMLDETLIVVKGEFGRTVGNITGQQGAIITFVHSALVAGGGSSAAGRSSAKRRPTAPTSKIRLVRRPAGLREDIAATIYSALGSTTQPFAATILLAAVSSTYLRRDIPGSP